VAFKVSVDLLEVGNIEEGEVRGVSLFPRHESPQEDRQKRGSNRLYLEYPEAHGVRL